jgi:hypothetical protein
MRLKMNTPGLVRIVTFLVVGCLPHGFAEQPRPHLDESEVPPGFEQLLQRGALASIDHPTYVSAEEAGISDDAWVFGVVINGKARAYSLRLLNSHEIVNDVISGQPVSAVW